MDSNIKRNLSYVYIFATSPAIPLNNLLPLSQLQALSWIVASLIKRLSRFSRRVRGDREAIEAALYFLRCARSSIDRWSWLPRRDRTATGLEAALTRRLNPERHKGGF